MQGALDSPLSDRGWQQADRLAQVFARIPLQAVYASPLKRAIDTAQRIAAVHGLPVTLVPGLRELNQGVWESLHFAEVRERYAELLQRWWADPTDVRVPGGETVEEMRNRAMAAVQEIMRRHAGERVVAVAHGGVNKAILLTLLGAPLASYWRLRQANACLNVLEVGNGPVQLLVLNQMNPWSVGIPE